MLAAYTKSEQQNQCFTLLGSNSILGSNRSENHSHVSLIASSTVSGDCGFDYCSFYSGASDSAIIAFNQNSESCGSIAYAGSSESCGSIAYSGSSESCGSIASSSCCSACSYSC